MDDFWKLPIPVIHPSDIDASHSPLPEQQGTLDKSFHSFFSEGLLMSNAHRKSGKDLSNYWLLL